MTRVFGVKRDRDEFGSRNLRSARMFFTAFPRLYPLLRTELGRAAGRVGPGSDSKGRMAREEAGVYPVLVLLAKLREAPASLEQDRFKVSDGGGSELK